MSKFARILVFILLALLSTTVALHGVLLQGVGYQKAIEEYPRKGFTFSVPSVDENKVEVVQYTLFSFTQEQDAIFLRRDNIFSPVDGSLEGYRLGVHGNVEKHANEVLLSFAGTELLNSNNLSQLLQSEPSSTLGLDSNSSDTIAKIPSIALGDRLTVLQLTQLWEKSGTISGEYALAGVPYDKFQTFIADLANTIGTDPDRLTNPLYGVTYESSPMVSLTLFVQIAILLLIAIIIFINLFLHIDNYGIHTLLGWSKIEYFIKTNRSYIIATACCGVIPAIITLSSFSQFGFNLDITV